MSDSDSSLDEEEESGSVTAGFFAVTDWALGFSCSESLDASSDESLSEEVGVAGFFAGAFLDSLLDLGLASFTSPLVFFDLLSSAVLLLEAPPFLTGREPFLLASLAELLLLLSLAGLVAALLDLPMVVL